MDYTASLIWLSIWPVVLYIGWKVSVKNAQKFEEKLKGLE